MNKTEEDIANAEAQQAEQNGNNGAEQGNQELDMQDVIPQLLGSHSSHQFLLDMMLHTMQPKAGMEEAVEKLKDHRNISSDELSEIMNSLGVDTANHTPANAAQAFIAKFSSPKKPELTDDETVDDDEDDDDSLPAIKIGKALSKLRSN